MFLSFCTLVLSWLNITEIWNFSTFYEYVKSTFESKNYRNVKDCMKM